VPAYQPGIFAGREHTSTVDVKTVEEEHGLIRVVSPAPKLQVLRCGRTSGAVGNNVVELEESALLTTAPISCHERAAPSVPEPDGSLDLRRDVARPRRAVRGSTV
jgi:hypothetical protein